MMTKSIYSLILFLLISLCLSAKDSRTVALVVNGKSISKKELQQKFDEFNQPLSASEKKSINEFLETYIYNTLVLEEARALQVDTIQSYKNEVKAYRNELASFYLKDTITEPMLIEELLHRMDQDLKVNQIFIPFDTTLVFARDTLAFYEQAMEDRRIAMEQGFDKVEKRVKNFTYGVALDLEMETGELGWIKPFVFSYKLETILYGAKLNEVTMPIRTLRGYHVLQVTDRRPAQGNPVVEQVMFNFSTIPASKAMKDSVYQVALETYNEIKTKGNFQTICDEFATAYDRGEDGCMLGEITIVEKIPLALIKAALEMKTQGEVSRPILTEYGWHILRLKEIKPTIDKNVLRQNVKGFMSTDKIFPEILSRQRELMLKKNKGKVNMKTYKKLFDLVDTYSPKTEAFKDNITFKDEEILSINNKVSYTVADFLEYVDVTLWLFDKPKNDDQLAQSNFTSMIHYYLAADILDAQLNGFVYTALSKYQEDFVGEKFPEFDLVINRLADELLYTRFLDQEIWTKSRLDLASLKELFAQNKDKYHLTKPLFKGMVIFARDEATISDIEKRYAQQPMTALELKRRYNKDAVTIHTEEGLWDDGDNRYYDAHKNKTQVKSVMRNFPYYTVLGKYISEPEELSDVQFQVEADYQERLETELAVRLQDKYEVTINNAVINTIK